MVKRLRRAAEDATSVSEGITCLLLIACFAGTGALVSPSEEELGEIARPELSGGPYRPSPDRSFPFPRFLLRPAPLRRDELPPVPARAPAEPAVRTGRIPSNPRALAGLVASAAARAVSGYRAAASSPVSAGGGGVVSSIRSRIGEVGFLVGGA